MDIRPAFYPAASPAEKEDSYPESTMWGVLPAYGFFVRHASNIRFRDCTFSFVSEDVRPVFRFDDVDNISVADLWAGSSKSTRACVVLADVKQCTIESTSVDGGGEAFVELVGAGNSGVRITNNRLRGIRNVITPAAEPPGVSISGNQQ